MKKMNLWKLLSGTLLFAAVSLVGCVDDNDDKGMPYLEVTPSVLTFDANGNAEAGNVVTVKTNRPWELNMDETAKSWVTPSATKGTGDATIEFSIPASNESRQETVTITLSNSYGTYFQKEVKITQGEVTNPFKLPTEIVTSFGEGFSTVTNNAIFDSSRWGFASSDPGYEGNPRLGWFGTIYSDGSKYLQCAPYNSTLNPVTAYAIMTPFNVKAAASKELTFKLAWYSINSTTSPIDNSKIEIVASTTVTDETVMDDNVWTVIGTVQYTEADPMNVYNDNTVDLSAYANDAKVYVAFRYVGHNNTYRLDDISFNNGVIGSLEVDPKSAALGETSGSTITLTITSSSDWTASASGTGFTIDKTSGTSADNTLIITATDANTGSTNKDLGSIVIANASGSVSVAVSQRAPSNDIFYESFGDLHEKLSQWPYINESPYVIRSGYGYVSGVSDYASSYASNRWTATTASPVDVGFSGEGMMWLAGNKTAYFEVQKLVLTTEKNLSIRFGLYGNTDPFDATKDKIQLELSSDGSNWVDVAFSIENVAGAKPEWKWANADITLKNAVSNLYMKITYVSGATGTRVDDVRITTGAGGTEIDLGGGGTTTPAVTTANASAITKTTATLGGSIANADLADYSAVGVEYVVWSTGDPDWATATKAAAATKATPWTVDVTDLTDVTQYAFRAYATPTTGAVVYGEQKSFVTGAATTKSITIPELLAMITSTDEAVDVSETTTYTFEAVVCGDPSAKNASFGTVYVMTPGATTANNGVTLYNSDLWNNGNYKLGDKVLVTLTAGVAKCQDYNNMKQISNISSGDVIIQSSDNAVTPIVISSVADLANYHAMPVTISAKATAAGTWMESAMNTTKKLDVNGVEMPVYFYKAAVDFIGKPYDAKTGDITGIAAAYKTTQQLIPRNLNDVKAFDTTAPLITGFNPDALMWTADDTSEKVITLTGVNLNGFNLSTLTAFNVTLDEQTVKVTPKAANAGAEIVESLTIEAIGGNSVTVTLTQGAAGQGIQFAITPTAADSGFPDKASTTEEGQYTIDSYTWGLFNGKQNQGYLMINGANGYLATPAIPGQTLKSIVITTSGGISGAAKVTILDADGNIVSDEQAVGTKNGVFTFAIANGAANTSYRITSTNKNTQLVKIEVLYQ